jgi:hypothetical protein
MLSNVERMFSLVCFYVEMDSNKTLLIEDKGWLI